MVDENTESTKPSQTKRIIEILIWLLLTTLTFLAYRADERRFESTVAFQSGAPFTLWQGQVTLMSVNLTTPGAVESINFSPPSKAFEGFDAPIGNLGSDPGRLWDGKPFELINNGSTLRVFAIINHPNPPGEVELQVWHPDHSGSKYKVIIKRTYYQQLETFIFDFMKASKETQERQERQEKDQQRDIENR